MSHFLWLFHVENVLHHGYKGGKAGKTKRHKKKKRIRKRVLLIIWRLHVSQFKLAAGVFSTASKEIKIQFKNATKITGKKKWKAAQKKIVQQKWANFVMVPRGGCCQKFGNGRSERVALGN